MPRHLSVVIIWIAVTVLLGASVPLSAQGMVIDRTDPTKPRDGLGIALELPISFSTGPSGSQGKPADYPRITAVLPNSPADSAGLRAGDVIIALDSVDVVKHRVNFRPPAGTVVLVRYRRGDATREVAVRSIRTYTPPDSLRRPRRD